MIITNAQPVANNKIQVLIKFLIVFLLSTLIVTLLFILIFGNLAQSITLKAVLKTITKFGIVISIPTAILFVLTDLLMKKIKILWVLYLVRGIVLFGLLWLVSLFFSIYLIANALFNNPFVK